MSTKPPSPKKSATKAAEEIRKDISPADFFGLTPVHIRLTPVDVQKDKKVLHSIHCRFFTDHFCGPGRAFGLVLCVCPGTVTRK